MKLIVTLIFSVLIFLIGCSKDEKPQVNQQQKNQNQQTNEQEAPADTNLTPEEKFSVSLMADFLDGSEDDDLADYLETEVYKMAAGYTGTSMVELSPAVWLITFEKDNAAKNYLLQKFVDYRSNDYYFRMKETPLTVSDVVSRSKPRVPAGE